MRPFSEFPQCPAYGPGSGEMTLPHYLGRKKIVRLFSRIFKKFAELHDSGKGGEDENH